MQRRMRLIAASGVVILITACSLSFLIGKNFPTTPKAQLEVGTVFVQQAPRMQISAGAVGNSASVGESEAKTYERLVAAFTAGSLSKIEWLAYWTSKASKDPAQALREYLLAPIDKDADRSTLDLLIQTFAEQDPIACIKEIRNAAVEANSERLLFKALTFIPLGDYVKVKSALHALDGAVSDKNVAVALLRNNMSIEKEEFQSHAKQLTAAGVNKNIIGEIYLAYLGQASMTSISDEVEIASAYLETQPEPSNENIQRFVAQLSNDESGDAFKAVFDLMNEDRYAAFSKLLRIEGMACWALKYPNQAGAWLASQKSSIDYQQMATGFVQAITLYDEESAETWLETITNPDLRKIATTRIRYNTSGLPDDLKSN